MKVSDIIDSPVNESYSEGDDSSFTHNGKTYQLDPFLKKSETIKPVYVPIEDVDWVIKYTDPDPERVSKADITVPALATNDPKWGLVVVDGLHRLAKAKELGKEKFLVKLLPPKWFSESINESNTYNIVKSKKFNKLKVKYSNKKSNITLLDKLVQTLRDSGEITDHNAHRIKQAISSDHAGKDVTGWVSVWISKSDDLRLAYNRFKDGTIEVKFGKASDIGYSH